MLLRDWRSRRELSLERVAAKVRAATGGKCNATVVRRWERHTHIPQRAEMVALYAVTAGEVTPNDFYELPELPTIVKVAA